MPRKIEIACTLEPEQMPERLAEWKALAAHVVERHDTTEGVRVRFDDTVDAVAVADLATREQQCCRFFEFSIGVDAAGVSLAVAAPTEARELTRSLLA